MTIKLPSPPTQDMVRLPEHESQEAQEAVYEALEFLREKWGYSGSRVAKLLRLSVSTVNTWLKKERVPIGRPPFDPTAEALLNLLAVHRSLDSMFSDSKNQVAWLETEHPELGFVPLEKIQESMEGLILVRQYLDYVRGRGA